MAAPMTGNSEMTALVVHTKNAQKMRCVLEKDGLWDSSRRLKTLEGDTVAIPVSAPHFFSMDEREYFIKEEKDKADDVDSRIPLEDVVLSGCYNDIPCHLATISLPLSRKQLVLTPHQALVKELRESFTKLDIPFPEELEKEIPNVWEKHGDLILLPQSSLLSSAWQCCNNLWDIVAGVLGGHRVARKGRVSQDGFRSPKMELLLGNDGWVEHKDNGIRYGYDIRHCMFSIGNITEKLRVARFDCTGETVVDLYAGIGYFTLPYLVHAHASLVHACEWSPHAVTALNNNLVLNNVQDRCVVHAGDNKQVCPRGVADRVNLGLIPSSEEGWPIACAALKPHKGGMLHIHGNVTSRLRTNTTDSAFGTTNTPKQENVRPCSGKRTACNKAPFKQQNDSILDTSGVHELVEKTSLTGVRTANTSMSKCNTEVRGEHLDAGVELFKLKMDILRAGTTKKFDSCLNSKMENEEEAIKCGGIGAVLYNDAAGQNNISQGYLQQNIKTLRNLPEINVEVPSGSTAEGSSPKLSAKDFWKTWAVSSAKRICEILNDVCGGQWTTVVTHIEHVKSYAPHVDHIVADIRCTPKSC